MKKRKVVRQNPGMVRGVGGPTDDLNIRALSDGEAVLPADSVQALGGPPAIRALIDATHVPLADRARGMADGGIVADSLDQRLHRGMERIHNAINGIGGSSNELVSYKKGNPYYYKGGEDYQPYQGDYGASLNNRPNQLFWNQHIDNLTAKRNSYRWGTPAWDLWNERVNNERIQWGERFNPNRVNTTNQMPMPVPKPMDPVVEPRLGVVTTELTQPLAQRAGMANGGIVGMKRGGMVNNDKAIYLDPWQGQDAYNTFGTHPDDGYRARYWRNATTLRGSGLSSPVNFGGDAVRMQADAQGQLFAPGQFMGRVSGDVLKAIDKENKNYYAADSAMRSAVGLKHGGIVGYKNGYDGESDDEYIARLEREKQAREALGMTSYGDVNPGVSLMERAAQNAQQAGEQAGAKVRPYVEAIRNVDLGTPPGGAYLADQMDQAKQQWDQGNKGTAAWAAARGLLTSPVVAAGETVRDFGSALGRAVGALPDMVSMAAQGTYGPEGAKPPLPKSQPTTVIPTVDLTDPNDFPKGSPKREVSPDQNPQKSSGGAQYGPNDQGINGGFGYRDAIRGGAEPLAPQEVGGTPGTQLTKQYEKDGTIITATADKEGKYNAFSGAGNMTQAQADADNSAYWDRQKALHAQGNAEFANFMGQQRAGRTGNPAFEQAGALASEAESRGLASRATAESSRVSMEQMQREAPLQLDLLRQKVAAGAISQQEAEAQAALIKAATDERLPEADRAKAAKRYRDLYMKNAEAMPKIAEESGVDDKLNPYKHAYAVYPDGRVERVANMASGKQGGPDPYVVGKTYPGANGTKAQYLGNGKWKELR